MTSVGENRSRIGIYVRESRDDNDENHETIETQRELLIEYVEKNNIGKIVEVYEDNNVSGSVFERQGINRLKKDVLSGCIDLLVLKDLSRLGRNNARTLLFLDYLEEYGVTVLTCDGRYDSRRDNDTVGIDTWYNERYVRDISRKIRANLRFKIRKGEYIGHAPFGYTKGKIEKNRLIVDFEKALIVKKIFELYLDGHGYSSIAKHLNQKGFISPGSSLKTGKGWNAVAVGRILSNRVYVGDTVQGISEKISFKSKKTRRLPAENWVITRGTHEPIVSIEIFEAVARLRLDKKVRGGPDKGDIHIFRGLLICGGCGCTMVARRRKNRPMGYICRSYAKNGKSSCTSHYINEKLLEAGFMSELSKLLTAGSVRADTKDRMTAEYTEKSISQNEVPKLEQQLFAKQRQQDILYQDKLDGKISEELFIRTNRALDARLSFLQAELLRLRKADSDMPDIDGMFTRAELLLKENGLTNRIACLIAERVTVFEPGDSLSNQTASLTEEEKKQLDRYGGLIINFHWSQPEFILAVK